MSTNVTWNGSSYSVPSTSEENWAGATKVDGLLIALATHGFQKTGGTFTLSADADFGITAGLKSIYYKSRGTVATTGVLRLGNAEVIAWRNAADSANIPLTVNSSNQLTFNGTVVFSSAGVVPIAAGGTGQTTATLGFDALSPMSALGDLIYGGASGTRTRLAGNTTTTKKYLQQQGDGANSAAPSWAQPAFSELSGNATVAQGGTNLTSYTAGDILYATGATTLAKLGIGTAGQVMKTNAGATAPEWGSAASSLAVTSKTSGYTLTSNDDVVFANADGGSSFTLALPAAASNTGKVYRIKKTGSDVTKTITIDPNSTETIDGASTYVLYTLGEEIEIVCDGSNWIILDHVTNTAWSSSPTFTQAGFGSTTSVDFWSRRVGDSLEVSGYFKVGTAGAEARIELPSGYTLDTTKYSATEKRFIVGNFWVSDTTNTAYVDATSHYRFGHLHLDPADTDSVFFAAGGGAVASAANKSNGNDLANSTEGIHVRFTVPISGWKA